jgi:hypothetical protein
VRTGIYSITIFIILFFYGTPSDLHAQVSDSTSTIEIDTYEDEEDEDGEDKDYYFIYRDYRETEPQPDRRIVSKEKLEEMRKHKGMWYVNVEPEKNEPKKPVRGTYIPITKRTWFQTFLWILIIASFAACLMIYLAGNRVGLFRRRSKENEEGQHDEEMPEDIFAINYEREIEKCEREGNFRMAVRLQFLRTLKKFAERNIIAYSQEKTNFDYLVQMHPTTYYAGFSRVTRAYEYTWYGKFSITEANYRSIRRDFEQLDSRMS